MLDSQSILITGGTGSFGQHFVRRVLERYQPRKIIVFSRDELKQSEMQRMFPFVSGGVMRYFLGDVRDLPRLQTAMEGVDIVIHAAALKQVPAAEYNPLEAIKTNVLGAQNVIEASIGAGVQRVVALSTDKAAAPINLYGATKLCADKLFVAANHYSGGHDIRFSVVRYGNVMGSRGSVIPLFMKMAKTGVLPITDKRMTRFNITLQQGVDFVLLCLGKMWGGELFVPKTPSYRITDVATAIDEHCNIEITGIRPGEKLHEEMITETDGLNTVEFEDSYVILPTSQPWWDIKKFIRESREQPGKMVPDGFFYDSVSNQEFLSVEELRDLIQTQMHDV
jgi:UDP-N-acetylglucosamine 4,6-dehydratase (inverting)